jgi:diguanylate cyclase (GGDEF)-like protein
MRRRLARADAVTAIVRAVNASLEPEKIANAIIDGISDWIPVSGWLLRFGDEGGVIRTIAARGLPPTLEGAALATAEFVMSGGDVFCSADVAADERLFPNDGFPPAAVIGIPLESRGRVLGAVVAIDRVPAAREPRFAASSLVVLGAALEPGAVALDNALRIQRAEALSVTDDLTQLYNSRYLSQVLRRETKRATRSSRPLSLLFIDLDGFKAVNDTHGHLAGSAALVEAAAVIRINARETDIVARFGGDEFALVLPDTGTDGAEMVGSRIREKIAVHQFLRKRGLDIRLTVSVGVATLPDVAASAEQLIHAADAAMYWVKDRGKNGVHVAGTDGDTARSARMAGIPKDAVTD